jgi:hypothetical protein
LIINFAHVPDGQIEDPVRVVWRTALTKADRGGEGTTGIFAEVRKVSKKVFRFLDLQDALVEVREVRHFQTNGLTRFTDFVLHGRYKALKKIATIDSFLGM